MKAVLFAGGIGTRLWPLSRKSSPKQFSGLIEDRTMFQITLDRFKDIVPDEKIFIATSNSNVETIYKQAPHISKDHVIGEPALRDLGPAVGLTAALHAKDDPDEPLMFIWAADQIFKNKDVYKQLLTAATNYLDNDPHKIIFIGETPRFPNQNLGWFEFGETVSTENDVDLHQFKGFHAKPDRETAERFTADGKHAWNIGDFVTTPGFILNLYKEYVPGAYDQLMKIQAAYKTPEFNKVLKDIYPNIEKFHQDNAVFEKMDPSNGLTVSGNLHWSDIGTWDAYKEAMHDAPEQPVEKGNVFGHGNKDALLFNDSNDQLVVGVDLDDIVVINTDDVVLVARKSSISDIKTVIEKLKQSEHKDKT